LEKESTVKPTPKKKPYWAPCDDDVSLVSLEDSDENPPYEFCSLKKCSVDSVRKDEEFVIT